MASRVYAATLFALYQITLLAGLLLFPVAVLTRKAGVPLPVGRAVSRLGEAYEQAG